MSNETRLATGRDGTRIGYSVTGEGRPTVILVGAALSDRSDHHRLARRLSTHLTVVNYDRRGRGGSDSGHSDGPDAEIADLAAIIEATGGTAVVFGSSSGGILALRAAERLGTSISHVVAYEPPLILDGSRPPVPADARAEVTRLLSEGRNAAAVRYFYGDIMGIPKAGVLAMRMMPGWTRGVRMADTLRNDLALMDGLQAATPLPAGCFAVVTQPCLILTGSKSEGFFHHGAAKLATALPTAEARILSGLHHGSAVMGAPALAKAIVDFTRAGSANADTRTERSSA